MNAQNSYWLNFFLKREINVVVWNYRGYGESTTNCCDYASPAKAKLDAERVLASLVTDLNLTGKIGVYGRSIGGIAATHLSAKYSDLITVVLIDRSLSEIELVVKGKLTGCGTDTLYKLATNNW